MTQNGPIRTIEIRDRTGRVVGTRGPHSVDHNRGRGQRGLLLTERNATSVIARESHSRSRDVGMRVVEIAPREVRRIVVGNPHAKKLEVARTIVSMGFPDLAVKLPKELPHPVLGYKPKDKYWLHMFDALAVAIAASSTAPSDGGESMTRA